MSSESLLENVDTAELLEHVDIEDILRNTDLRKLLKQVNLEAVLGGFGAAAGRELGAVAGRKFDAALSSSKGDSGDTSDEAADETADEDGGGESVSGRPETREELESLSYRELQSLARDTDVKGNISRERMIEQLAEEFGLDSE